MKENYPKAYKEVLEILKHMPEDDVKKIPKELLETFEYKKDIAYNFYINENQDFSKLKILDETEAIMINIFTDYWATQEQKEKIIAKQRYDNQAMEERKQKTYNVDNLFKNKTEEIIDERELQENSNLPIEYKQRFYQKFIDFIKRILKL